MKSFAPKISALILCYINFKVFKKVAHFPTGSRKGVLMMRTRSTGPSVPHLGVYFLENKLQAEKDVFRNSPDIHRNRGPIPTKMSQLKN